MRRQTLELVEKEKGLLDIPTNGRDEVIKMPYISYSYAKKRLKSRIDEIYRDRTKQLGPEKF